MANYKDIKGFDIQNSSSDFTSVGQIYYNSSSGVFKAVKDGGAPIGTWAAGGSLNTARLVYGGSFGATVPTTVIAGGETTTALAVTEAYNGSTYTEVADLNTARGAAGGDGSSTAGIVIGGETTTLVTNTETWDGSSWTEVNDINTATRLAGSTTSGTNTAVLLFGGLAPSNSAKTESWNGSSWTEVNDLNTARYGSMGSGVSTAALSSSGASPPIPNVESWNGTSWTEITDVNTARRGGGSVGRQTDTLIYGGDPSHAQTEFWNGTSWTEVNDLGSAQQWGGGGANGASTAAIFSGGQGPVATTQEWDAASFEIKTLTTS